ncbi:MAG: YceI family protein [Sandaracinaceae bacterium]|nr:YceI family protein [Sandaracinaceae bacterium]
MSRITEREARCRVYTFKEGLLSAVAHDLEIEVSRFWIESPDDGSRVTAEMDARSLRVISAMSDGRPNPSALSDKDKRKIEQTIVDDVLVASRHPAVRFEGTLTWTSGVPRVEGTLTLAGRSRAQHVEVTVDGGELVARASIHQPDYGIAPYSAMLGTLKIKADVRVEVRVPEAHRPIAQRP